MNPISKKAAREQGLVHYFTGRPCKRGHIGKRFVSDGSCQTCAISRASEWGNKNKEQVREAHKIYCKRNYAKHHEFHIKRMQEWRTSNREAHRAIARKNYYENREFRLKTMKKYREENPETFALSNKNWRANNWPKVVAKNRRRDALKLKAAPPWLNVGHLIEIESFYELAHVLTSITGTRHHVDHIYPLQGKEARGLHVPWNLQVLTASENCRKGRKMPENVPMVYFDLLGDFRTLKE